MINDCHFSPCRTYRYRLLHRWDELVTPRRRIMWIGLNPSTAAENQLDPTLRRIKGFSTAWGFNEFVMTNLFAFRSTLPREMLRHHAPIGPENDQAIITSAFCSDMVVACWGQHGSHLAQDEHVIKLLLGIGVPLFAIALNDNKSPRHPLYVPRTNKPFLFRPKKP